MWLFAAQCQTSVPAGMVVVVIDLSLRGLLDLNFTDTGTVADEYHAPAWGDMRRQHPSELVRLH